MTQLDGIDDVLEAYAKERDQVRPPNAFRSTLAAPLSAVDKAMMVPDELQAALEAVDAGIDDGRFGADQASRLRAAAIQRAEQKAEGLITPGKTALALLPRKLAGDAFPDNPPGDAADRKADLQMALSSYDERSLPKAFIDRVTEAVEHGEPKTAQLLLSRWGRDLVASRIGRDATEELWPSLRQQAMEAATDRADGTLGDTLKARRQVQQVERAFVAGINAVHMRMESASRSRH